MPKRPNHLGNVGLLSEEAAVPARTAGVRSRRLRSEVLPDPGRRRLRAELHLRSSMPMRGGWDPYSPEGSSPLPLGPPLRLVLPGQHRPWLFLRPHLPPLAHHLAASWDSPIPLLSRRRLGRVIHTRP